MTVMTFSTLRTVLAKSRRRHTTSSASNHRLLSVLCMIWVLSAAHWIINVYRAYSAFMLFPAGPVAFYNTLSLPSYTARNTVYCLLTVLADSFVVYRCYVVWQRRWWIVVIPALLLISTLVTGIGVIYSFHQATPGNVVFIKQVKPWVTSYVAVTLATNVLCTSLIAFRVIRNRMYLSSVNLARTSNDPLWTFLVVVMESAAIYSSALIVLMVLYSMNSNAQYVALDITVSTIGIAFTMIILRVSLGKSSDTQAFGSTTETLRVPSSSNRAHDLNVNVARLVEVNRDYSLKDSTHKLNTDVEDGSDKVHFDN
ncbi:hypothetical protein R3P38DRAFT_2901092 [Favolaschia claudopus]|uniref:Uncharacterized protein n=1 Tax=Favolaschia claudopus TaxID=2862362 RepID=A0AAW0CL55_9AGAR